MNGALPGFFPANVRVMLIEDEDFDVRRVRATIAPYATHIDLRTHVSNGDAALDILRRKGHEYDVVIMDMQIAGGVRGEQLIRSIKQADPSLQIIVITKMTVNITDFDFANRLLRSGAFWYCTKYPADIESAIYQPTDFIISIFNAFEKCRLERERNRSERKLLRNVEDILARTRLLGISEQMQKLRGQIQQVAAAQATVLITGPSGTGKELVATQVHYSSDRRLENFVTVNCGGIPSDLIESELFGYEKGAFTGADRSKQGLFEVAHNGTIFLDEVSELPPAAQVKLLRVLQEGEIEKIGRTEKLSVDVRVIAATNKVLFDEVNAGRFREDLYYRLNVIPLNISPLTSRPDDVPVLWEHFVRHFSAEMGRSNPDTTDDAFDLLRSYAWPGNVRELKNLVQRVLLMEPATIDADTLRSWVSIPGGAPAVEGADVIRIRSGDPIIPLRELERSVRKQYTEHVRRLSGSDAEAADRLGLAPSNFHRMCKDLGLKD